MNGVNISCFGGTDGTAFLESITGGSAPFTYYWSTGDSTDTLSNIGSGSYILNVIDVNGCLNHASIDLTQPDILNSQFSTSHYPSLADPIQFEISCNGLADGYINIDTVIGGVGPYTYSWLSRPETTDSIGSIPAGTYQYTVTDANNCMLSVDVILTEPDPILVIAGVSDFNGFQIACNGDASGFIDLTVFGGTVNTDYTYSWSPNVGDVTPSVANLTAGTYCVHVADDNGCAVDTCFDMTEPTPLVIDSIVSPVYPGGWNVSCNGGDNGNIFSYESGAVSPYTYYWSNGDTTANTLNVSVFTYYLTVTDLNGCTANDSITINEPALVSTTIDIQTNVNCFGDASGSITVSSVGGTPGYNYSLDGITFSPAATIGNLIAGSYTLYTADTNGCMDSISFTITEPVAALSAQVTAQTNVDCFGNSSGDVTVTGADGTPPYQYSIDGVTFQSSGTFSSLIAGNYTVTVLDSNGCTITQGVSISEPSGPLSVAVSSVTNVDCFGNSSGTILVSGSMGTSPYQFSIDGVTFSPDSSFTGLIAGNYTITIQDTNGCSATVNASISEPAAALSAVFSATDALCNGSSDGTAQVTPSGGTPGYTYQWSTVPVQTTQTATGLMAGTYSCLITDTNNCTYNVTGITVGQATVLNGSATSTDVLCNGGNTGTASAIPSGGTPGYTYSWNTVPVQTTSTATGLIAGSYSCVITDTNSCAVTVNVIVGEPSAITASSTSTDVLCNGGSTGTAIVSPSGGIPGYSFSWNTVPVQTTQTATGLSQGTYSCLITDSNNCTLSVDVTVAEPAALSASTAATDVLCNGGATGTATVNPSGGVPGYAYSWNTVPVQITQVASGLSTGTYTCTVTDTNNCVASYSVTVNEPAAISATSSATDVDCNGNANGIAGVNASGGVLPYTYSWNTVPVQTSDTATGLTAGSYVCTITDSNLCTFDVTVTVNQPNVLAVTVTGTGSVTCNAGSDGVAIANVTGGTTAYSYSWSPVGGSNDTLSGLASGTYTVTVTDFNGCTGSGSFTITDPPALTTTANGLPEVCGSSAGLTGTLQNNQSGLWTSSDPGVNFDDATSTGAQASGLQYGSSTGFTWTVTDNTTGCMATASFQVIADEPVTAEISPEDTLFCLHSPDYDGHFHVDAVPPVPGTGTWTVAVGTGTIDNPTSTTIRYFTDQPGTSILVWTVVNGECSATDNVSLQLKNDGPCLDLDLPTGFTPNSDTYNDDYDIHGIENYPQNTFMVFNRWGNEVYKKDNYVNHDWKGDNNSGHPLPDGTYYVILIINDGNNKLTRNTYVDLRR